MWQQPVWRSVHGLSVTSSPVLILQCFSWKMCSYPSQPAHHFSLHKFCMGGFPANENSCLCTKVVPVVKHMDVEMCLSAFSENELDVTQELMWYNMCLLSVRPMQAQLRKPLGRGVQFQSIKPGSCSPSVCESLSGNSQQGLVADTRAPKASEWHLELPQGNSQLSQSPLQLQWLCQGTLFVLVIRMQPSTCSSWS